MSANIIFNIFEVEMIGIKVLIFVDNKLDISHLRFTNNSIYIFISHSLISGHKTINLWI